MIYKLGFNMSKKEIYKRVSTYNEMVNTLNMSREAFKLILSNTQRIVTDDADELSFKALCANIRIEKRKRNSR